MTVERLAKSPQFLTSPDVKPLSPEEIELQFYEQFFFSKDIEPYPVQEEAFEHIFAGDNLMVTVPTGTGKTMIAKSAMHKALHAGQTAIFTTPLRALTEEKYREFCEDFGARNVGFATGDYKVNPNAPLQVMVAEILWNKIFSSRQVMPADVVVMDEGHYFNDFDRGYVWEQSLIGLHPRTQVVVLSATVGNPQAFCQWCYLVRRAPMKLVESYVRRIPLYHEYREDYLLEVVRQLNHDGNVPVIIFNFSRQQCFEQARLLKSCRRFTTDEEKAEIERQIETVLQPRGLGDKLRSLLLHGIGIHHAGILPAYKRLVEELTLQRLLKFVVSTETISAGINLPAKRVLFPSLRKVIRRKHRLLVPAEYHQMAGRAGRPQFDTEGIAITLAPEEVVQEFRKELKEAKRNRYSYDEAKLRQRAYSRARTDAQRTGSISWDQEAHQKLVDGKSANLKSHTKLTSEQVLAIGLPDLTRYRLPGMEQVEAEMLARAREQAKRDEAQGLADEARRAVEAKVQERVAAEAQAELGDATTVSPTATPPASSELGAPSQQAASPEASDRAASQESAPAETPAPAPQGPPTAEEREAKRKKHRAPLSNNSMAGALQALLQKKQPAPAEATTQDTAPPQPDTTPKATAEHATTSGSGSAQAAESIPSASAETKARENDATSHTKPTAEEREAKRKKHRAPLSNNSMAGALQALLQKKQPAPTEPEKAEATTVEASAPEPASTSSAPTSPVGEAKTTASTPKASETTAAQADETTAVVATSENAATAKSEETHPSKKPPPLSMEGMPAYLHLNISTVINNLLLPDQEKREAQKLLVKITNNLRALGVLNEQGKQVKGFLINQIRGIDGTFIYDCLMHHDLTYPQMVELVEYLVDHDTIQRRLDRKEEDKKREWMRARLRERRQTEAQVAWEDVEAEYNLKFPRELTFIEKVHGEFLKKVPHQELHARKKAKSVWAIFEREQCSIMDFVEKHKLEEEEGSLFSYLTRVMRVAKSLHEVTKLQHLKLIEMRVRSKLAVLDERILDDVWAMQAMELEFPSPQALKEKEEQKQHMSTAETDHEHRDDDVVFRNEIDDLAE